MSRRSDENLRGIPMKPYDLLREGLIVFTLLLVLVFVLAILLGSPDYPTVRSEDVAKRQPSAFLKTSAGILAGNSSLQDYGPPYTPNNANAQRIFGIAPASWFGVANPIDPAQDFVLKPLERAAVLDPDLTQALQDYRIATPDQQLAWANAYLAALDHASVENGQIQTPKGDYGPMEVLMNGMLALGRAGLLEGAIESNARLPFELDFTRSLLFFQDDVDHSVAGTLDMLGGVWGISHETGPYPGAWWLWPYTFFYQISPMSASPNGDLQVAVIITLIFLITLFTPFIPVLNRLPHWLGVYKLIWRDWYRRSSSS
jgi:hypothetical protein